MLRLKVVRSWISRSGPKAQRQTTFVFSLSRAGIVELVLTRLAPDCRVVGKFRVVGRAGLNRVRFRGRIGRRLKSLWNKLVPIWDDRTFYDFVASSEAFPNPT